MFDFVKQALEYSGKKVSLEDLKTKRNDITVANALAKEVLCEVYSKYSFSELKANSISLHKLVTKNKRSIKNVKLALEMFALQQGAKRLDRNIFD